ncbi:MAG: putative type IV pilus assembly family protein [Dehalococcoidia bacterium]|nr:putative type IV pilus assembly family protein [Dehalococcoidia bacterium]
MLSNSYISKPRKVYRLFIGNPRFWNWCLLVSFKKLLYSGSNLIRFVSKRSPFVRKLVTLSVEDDGMHLVVFRGTDVERWDSSYLKPGIVKDGGIVNPDELGGLIYEFLKRQHIKNRKVICSISGFHSLSRIITLPKLSSSSIYEAIGREAARAIPTATDASHIFWHILSQTRSYQRFYILATPKGNLDRIATALKKGKTVGDKVEIKPLALARLIKQQQAIIVDIQSYSVDVVIVVQGVPAFFRMLNRDDQTSISTIAGEISRTIEYFNRNNAQQPIKADNPVFITGSLCMNENDIKQFSTITNHPVEKLDVSLSYPPEFSLGKYAVNVGLALGLISNKNTMTFQWVNINVLSAIYRPYRGVLKVSMIGAAAMLGIMAIFPIYQMSSKVAVAKDQVQAEWYRLNQEVVLKRLAKRESVKLESNIKEVEVQTEKLEKAQEVITGQNKRFAVPLAVVYETITPGLSVDSVVMSNRLIQLQGKTDDYEAIVKFIASLEGKGLFSSVRVSNIIQPNPQMPEISFSLELKEK